MELLTVANRIHARNCTIDVVNPTIAKQFFVNNHIQGHANAKITYGLYENSVLVAAMSFSHLSKAKGYTHVTGQWELLRFCTLLNTNIPGSATRLFSRFIKDISPDEVLSFADLRWSNGAVYSYMGFEFVSDTRIGYWYIDTKKLIRHHRYGFRKNKNDNQLLTEYENRLQQGYLRIWDCGHAKWIWKKKATS